MTRAVLAEVINKVKQTSVLKDTVVGKKAQYDPESQRITLLFEPTAHQLPEDLLSIRNALSECGCDEVSLLVSQQRYADDLIGDNALLTQCVKDCCVLHEPIILPFISPAHVELEGKTVTVSMRTKEEIEVCAGLGLENWVETYFADTYDMDVRVRIQQNESACEENYQPPMSVQERSSLEPDPVPVPAPVCPVPVAAADSVSAEAAPRRAREVPSVKTCDLVEGKRCAVDVRVVSAEERSVKNGELTIHTLCATDNTSSISALLFESKGRPGPGPVPRPGTWVRLVGRLETDSYSKEPVFKISDIQPSEHVDRTDSCDAKRIELHAHTKMSAMDAVTGTRDLVKRAIDWGHDAIAITDHGVTQAFPAAAAAAGDKIKLIYGVEAYMFDDTTSPWCADTEGELDGEYVVFDLETTGLCPYNAQIIEIGAVRILGGRIKDTFQTYVASDTSIPPSVTELTGITDEKLKGAPQLQEALQSFLAFVQDAPLAAHNAPFDMGFLQCAAEQFGLEVPLNVLDTLRLAPLVFPDLRSYKLTSIAAHLGISYDAHRASSDAMCTARVLLACFERLESQAIRALSELSKLMTPQAVYHSAKTYHIILLCRDKQGMVDLNRLVSRSHIEYLDRKKPKMPRSEIEALREHLIIGSACESGELYTAALEGASDKELRKVAQFYDYLEIQPVGNNKFLTRTGKLPDDEAIRGMNRRIVSIGDALGVPVAATCDVHFLDPEDECYRRILQSAMGFDSVEQPPLFFRTTQEMLDEFAYLGPEKANEVVVEVPNRIAEQIGTYELLPEETAMPVIDGAAEEIERMAYANAKAKYGDPLPEIVEKRLERELGSIIGHGFSVLYYSAHKLVSKSNEDGYLVGSRGSVGSSLTATMTGITEVNPLPPHYICPACRHSDFDVDRDKYDCGVDLPDAVCPECGTAYKKEGFNIPFEVFLGIDADKVPDIDLNFSGEYQNRAHKYTEELFGKNQVFRAGTISGLQAKNAYGYVKHFAEDTGQNISSAEAARLQAGLQGVKKTTGQHPGGMVIVPRGHEIYEYTAVQWPANEAGADFVTTHFDFRSMHDVLVKLDILGHDAPTIMRLMQDITGVDPLDIPLADPDALRLFSSIEPLGIAPEDLFGISKGTLGVPEFGTSFVRQMLEDTKPTTVSEIVRICGLSHGTGVWLGNAQELIKQGTCQLSEAICARDDIMNYLVARGVDKRQAFFIMENTRKGKVAKNGFSDSESEQMTAAEVPQWFIDACLKIQYLFPKGHAVAYCLMALRIAYCKIYHKEAFYATYFDVNTDRFDATLVSDGLAGIRSQHESIARKGNAMSENERSTATILEVCAEMYLRGIQFLRVDIEKSDPIRFTIEDGGIRMPLVAVPQLGEKVACAIAQERRIAPFLSIEDLKRRTKLSSSVADAMKKTGALAGLSGRDQLSLFDAI